MREGYSEVEELIVAYLEQSLGHMHAEILILYPNSGGRGNYSYCNLILVSSVQV